ncbi:MAG: diguanylate cyclase [Clostridia bacterium]|nr:diguanylate cyclase [Clostridia bacterium]
MKKTRTMQFQLLCITVVAIIFISLLVGGISIFEFDQYVQSSTGSMLDALCDKESERINSLFGGMENSVRVMASYVLDFYETEADVADEAKRAEVEENAAVMFIDVAKFTEGAIAYHLRFNPELFGGTAGFYYSKRADNGEFCQYPTTDLNRYDESDTDAVGWFWQPYRAGEAVWIMPYNYKGTGTRMISFAKPLYFEEKFIGVVGMDFDYTAITNRIDEIRVHDNGFAFLAHGDHIAYHKDVALKDTTPDFSKDYEQSSRDLRNGMTLVLLAHKGDLRSIRYGVELSVAATILILLAVAVLATVIAVRRFASPLVRLAESAVKLSGGDYNVETVQSGIEEIEVLNSAFVKMAEQLSAHDKYQHRLAYRDALTGLRNVASFKAWQEDFSPATDGGVKKFGIVVLDINFLKETNDKFGHSIGDRVIVAAARTISYVFKRSPVFRIGGDEFVVVLQGHDLEDHVDLIHQMQEKAKEEYIAFGESLVPVSIAYGVAIYGDNGEESFSDVFNRADAKMYENKKAMKDTITV